jgi:hypothetical protein
MPLYSVEPGDDAALGRVVMNLEVMGRFQTGEHMSMDLGPGLAAVTCPVLVVSGELDPICPPEMGEEIVAALLNAEVTFVRVPDASHDDARPRASDAIRSFITDRAGGHKHRLCHGAESSTSADCDHVAESPSAPPTGTLSAAAPQLPLPARDGDDLWSMPIRSSGSGGCHARLRRWRSPRPCG